MPVELHILGLIVVFFGVAYFTIYPRMEPKNVTRMVQIDVVLFAILLLIAGSVYFGKGMRFSLILFDANWWVFTIICASLIEIPFFVWFCRKWGIDLTGNGK